MNTLLRFAFFACCVALAFPMLLRAGERRFTYVYDTEVQPVGAREIEVWNTYRTGRTDFYRRIDNRLELEFGVTQGLASSIYLNNTVRTAQVGNNLVSSQSMSISSEWKYQILNPVVDPIGFGLYGEITLGTSETELEGKLLLDKRFDKLLVAVNAVYEQEWESEIEDGKVESESETKTELNAGIAYFITNNFTVGAEARIHSVIEDGKTEHSALFAGPAISYSTEGWWATLTLMPQLASFKEKTDGSLDLKEYEKMQARLIFAFHI